MNYASHVGCGPWRQRGGVVVCDCGTPLYHGKIPRDRVAMAKALDDLVMSVRRRIESGEIKVEEPRREGS